MQRWGQLFLYQCLYPALDNNKQLVSSPGKDKIMLPCVFHPMLGFESQIEHSNSSVSNNVYSFEAEAFLLTTVQQVHVSCLSKGEYQIETELAFMKCLLQAGNFLSTYTIMNGYINKIIW